MAVAPNGDRTLVEQERWLSPQQFVELLTLGQVLPGPNIINMAIVIGDRFLGWRGALAACAGLLLVPMFIVLGLAIAYQQQAAHPAVAGALRGMGAVAAALVLATAVKLARTLKGNPLGMPASIAIGATAFARLVEEFGGETLTIPALAEAMGDAVMLDSPRDLERINKIMERMGEVE